MKLYDDTLRDGEQMAGQAFTAAQKLSLARALAEAGVQVMQAGFPAACKGELETCASLLAARRKGSLPKKLELVLMARPREEDLQACLAACKSAAVNPASVSLVLLGSVSDLHLRHKLTRRLAESLGLTPASVKHAPIVALRRAALDMALAAVLRAKVLGFGLVEVAIEDASRADPAWVRIFALACCDAGARRIAFCDTCGVLTPERVETLLPPLAESLGTARGRAELAVHFHDDYGLAAANTVKAALCGATHLTVTLNGLGERAGNAALHRVLLPLRDLYGISFPDFRYRRLRALSVLAERLSGDLIPVHETGVGSGAFRHESGLHVAALLEHAGTYQALNPISVGGRMEFAYGKHSGTAAVAKALGKQASTFRVCQVTKHLKTNVQKRRSSREFKQAVDALFSARQALQKYQILSKQDVRALI